MLQKFSSLLLLLTFICFAFAINDPVAAQNNCQTAKATNRFVTNVTPFSFVGHWTYPPIPTNAMVIRYKRVDGLFWHFLYLGNPTLPCNQAGYPINENNHYVRQINNLQPGTEYYWQVYAALDPGCPDSCGCPGAPDCPRVMTQMMSGKQLEEPMETGTITTSLLFSPNPTTDELTVSLQDESDHRMATVMDINGKIVLTQEAHSAFTTINVRQLPQGIYLMRITESGQPILQGRFLKLNQD